MTDYRDGGVIREVLFVPTPPYANAGIIREVIVQGLAVYQNAVVVREVLVSTVTAPVTYSASQMLFS